jgi:hypothetical protein
LYDALDFSTDRDDGGGQTRESLSRIALLSAAVAGLDPVRFAHEVQRWLQVLRLVTRLNTASERMAISGGGATMNTQTKTLQTSNAQRPTPNIEFRTKAGVE